VLGISTLSCVNEKIIENTQDSWKVLISIKNPTPVLALYEYPSGKVLSQDVYLENNGSSLSSVPEKMAEYANAIFLIFTEGKKIVSLNSKSFKKNGELDFTASNKTPLSICFANATTAYIIFKNDSIVDVLDLTVFQITSSINIRKITTAIACYGNRIVIANGPSNTVTVMATNDNSVIGTINVEPYPCLVDFTADGAKAVVISAGSGKFDSTAKTNAVAQTIDYALMQPMEKVDLGVGIVKPIEQIPQSLAHNSKVYCFVGTQQYLLRYITRTGNQISRIDNGNYLSVIYNFKREEMIYVKQIGTTFQLKTSNPATSEMKATYTLPSGYVALLPL